MALALAALVALAACGSERAASPAEEQVGEGIAVPDAEGLMPMRPIEGLKQQVVGRGTSAAILVWREELAEPPRDAVVFLHAWPTFPPMPYAYRSWFSHLAEQDLTVVFPIYQDTRSTLDELAENVVSGVSVGLREIDARDRTLVVAGHTTGGALAVDYAAEAAAHGLPRPRGVLAIYPARNPLEDETIPASDLSQVPRTTRVEVISGSGNPVLAGERQARRLFESLSHIPERLRRYHTVPGRQRGGPWKDDRGARRAFWRPLDRLIEAVHEDAQEGGTP